MPKILKIKSTGKEIYYVSNSFEDLVNTEDERFQMNKKFGTYASLLKTYLKANQKQLKILGKTKFANRTARKIIRLFLREMLNDLIYKNDTYKLPYYRGKFGVLKVRDDKEIGMFKNSKTPLEFNPHRHHVVFTPNYKYPALRDNDYFVKLNKAWYKRLREEEEKGHRY